MRKEIKFGIITVSVQGTTIIAKERSAVFACKRYENEEIAENMFAIISELMNGLKIEGKLRETNISDCVSVRRMIKEQMR